MRIESLILGSGQYVKLFIIIIVTVTHNFTLLEKTMLKMNSRNSETEKTLKSTVWCG